MNVRAIRECTKEEIKNIREIAKSFGVKFCSKTTFYVYIGRQTHRINSTNANNLIIALKAVGLFIVDEEICMELAAKDMLDTIMVAKFVL